MNSQDFLQVPTNSEAASGAAVARGFRRTAGSSRSAANRLVEHRDALAHVIQRGLQDLAVDNGSRRGESSSSFSAALVGDGALAQQQRHHQARRRRRRSRRRSGARHAAAVRNRPRAAGSRLMPAWSAAKVSKRGTGAVGAEILRHRALDILHRHGGAPAPEGRRDRWPACSARTGRLAAVRSTTARRSDRQHDISQDVERERPRARRAASGGRSAPNSACGRSASMPNGPCCNRSCWPAVVVSGEARQEQRVDPNGDADQSCRRWRHARSPAAKTDRRRRPVPAGRWPRTTADRSLRAGCCRAER